MLNIFPNVVGIATLKPVLMLLSFVWFSFTVQDIHSTFFGNIMVVPPVLQRVLWNKY